MTASRTRSTLFTAAAEETGPARAAVTEANRRDHAMGGRPAAYPDWCLLLFGCCIRIFGCASATGRALADPTLWQQVVGGATEVPEAAVRLAGIRRRAHIDLSRRWLPGPHLQPHVAIA